MASSVETAAAAGPWIRLALVAAALLLCTGCGAIRAGRLLQDALGPAGALADTVAETSVKVTAVGGVVPVRVYRPIDETDPLPGVVLVHGAVEGGAADRRLVALARAVAAQGSTVATPDLASLAAFRLDPDDPVRIARVVEWLRDRRDLVEDAPVACVGISVGGSYALLAAARPPAREKVRCVLTFGAYADLKTLLRVWLENPRSDVPGLLDARTEGRRKVLLGNVGVLVPAEDHEHVRNGLRDLLAGFDAPRRPGNVGSRGRLVLAVAASTDPVRSDVVTRLIRPLEKTVAELSPVNEPGAPTASVYLLHGEGDPVVPPDHLDQLVAVLTERGVTVRSHLTDLFSHVEGRSDVGFFESLPLLFFVAAAMDAAGL